MHLILHCRLVHEYMQYAIWLYCGSILCDSSKLLLSEISELSPYPDYMYQDNIESPSTRL